jgi:uncharacterized lipoprotein YmbA
MIRFFPGIMNCLLILTGSALLCSCIGSRPAIHEYTLFPLLSSNTEKFSAPAAFSILLMPVILPPQNSSTGIVTRQSNNTVTTSSTHLWAGNLQDQITATLAENMRKLATDSNVMIYPGSRYGDPELLVEIQLFRFDGGIPGTFTCTALWSLSDNQKAELLEQKNFSTTVPVDSDDYSGYVQAASISIGRLSKAVTLSLQKNRRLP